MVLQYSEDALLKAYLRLPHVFLPWCFMHIDNCNIDNCSRHVQTMDTTVYLITHNEFEQEGDRLTSFSTNLNERMDCSSIQPKNTNLSVILSKNLINKVEGRHYFFQKLSTWLS